MAAKKAITNKPSPSTPSSYVSQLIRDCNILDSIKIRPLVKEKENKWRTLGLGDDNLLVLGKRHIETIRLPIHPMIFAIFICSADSFDAAHSNFS